ncbi:MAG: type 11 methyltransferase [Candidatus Sumerlaea sp.]|uniref:S-adenosylmethionine-dependent methyltransferase n=1 Tax=Sumerlaea chitinivorans TaxID=2250252 RepID=A0A2Z4Y3K2_SUMC1|nr:S-adenosylmethionine-dependent methyltransferase [Candidatus Sumerlaea chitinivorans]GIX44516.1 MAG: type 11 methyltransferase [Candidatus Sumerlaea sp.]
MRNDEYSRMFAVEDTFWWYVALRRFLVRETHKRLGTFGNDRNTQREEPWILDAGCGTGANLNALSCFGRCIGVDISPTALNLARRRGLSNLARGSVLQLPVRPESVDVLLSIDVLYHVWVKDDLAALMEYHRALRPGGWLIVHVAAHEWLRGSHDEVVMTRHRYTLKELVERVESAGFRVHRQTYRNTFVLPLMLIARVLGRGKSKSESDLRPLPRWLNTLLLVVMKVEEFVLSFTNLPIGSSAYVVAQKPLT